MIITSRANPAIKKIASLQDKKFRRQYGEFLVEGIKSVNECVSSGMEITKIVCTEALYESFPQALVVSKELFERISTEKTPQGVIASVKLPGTAPQKPEGDCILLDRVQDPGNLGTVIRTANAAGYGDVYLVGCTDAFSPKAVRASMGGVFHVRVHEGSFEEVKKALNGFTLITADMDGENVFCFNPPENFCLCIGNEGNGIGEEVAKSSRYTIKIPMRATCESLNAAVSAGIAMYALKNNARR